MRFKLINEKGKPAVALVENGVIVSRDLADLHECFIQSYCATAQEAHWFGMAEVLFAVLSLLRWGNPVTQTNLLKTLDAFYFSSPQSDIEQAFYRGVTEAIEFAILAKLEGTEQDVVERLAEKLGY